MKTIFLLFLLYIVIFLAVKHGINRSHIGQIFKNKYPNNIEDKNTKVSDEEIERELQKYSDEK